MGETESSVTVLDAGPVIHLDQLGGLDLLEGLGAVYLPATVKGEILRHRPSLSFAANPYCFVCLVYFVVTTSLSGVNTPPRPQRRP